MRKKVSAYRKRLDWLEDQLLYSITPSEHLLIKSIIKELRNGFFIKNKYHIYDKFYPSDNVLHPEECECWLIKNTDWAIRKFGNYYYLVKVLNLDDSFMVIETENPDEEL